MGGGAAAPADAIGEPLSLTVLVQPCIERHREALAGARRGTNPKLSERA